MIYALPNILISNRTPRALAVWIGDAIVKGYIKVAPRMFVQHPRIDLKFRQEEGAAAAAAPAEEAAPAAGEPISPTDKRGKYRVLAKV